MVAVRMNSPASGPTKVPQHGACLPLDDIVGRSAQVTAGSVGELPPLDQASRRS